MTIQLIRFEPPPVRPPHCHFVGRLLRRAVVEGRSPSLRLKALLELPRYLSRVPVGWWWLMREGAQALVAAAAQLVEAAPALAAARVAHAELVLLHGWFHTCQGWSPRDAPLGGPSRGLFRALTRLSIDAGNAEAQVHLLQRHTFNKAARCQAHWVEYLDRALSPFDRRRIEALLRLTRSEPGYAEEIVRHGHRLQQLALDFAQQYLLRREG